MPYRDATAFRLALEQRLNEGAAGDDTRIAEARKQVVIERVLARLHNVAPGDWILVGGFPFSCDWQGRRGTCTATRSDDIRYDINQ